MSVVQFMQSACNYTFLLDVLHQGSVDNMHFMQYLVQLRQTPFISLTHHNNLYKLQIL